MRWNAQSSGTTIPANVARALEEVWSELLEGLLAKPTITPGSAKLYEGTAYAVTLTRYERNRRARRECIAYYGASCFRCELNFGYVYGRAGEGYIQVHHITPLSESDNVPHEVDPVEDLRPVCPNCHAVIHRRSPPYTMEEMRTLLTDNG